MLGTKLENRIASMVFSLFFFFFGFRFGSVWLQPRGQVVFCVSLFSLLFLAPLSVLLRPEQPGPEGCIALLRGDSARAGQLFSSQRTMLTSFLSFFRSHFLLYTTTTTTTTTPSTTNRGYDGDIESNGGQDWWW